MKLLLVIAVGFLAVSATSFGKEDDSSRIHGENGWYVPQENDTLLWVDKEEFQDYRDMNENYRGLSLSPVHFYLYTNENPTKKKEITDSAKSIKKSNFNPDHPTKFVIHGFLQGRLSGMNKDIRKAILSQGDCNCIIVDWARARSVDYISSVLAVRNVGKKVAHMIDTLVLHGMSLDDTTIIGHSLGAQVAGYAAKFLNSGQVGTIYGLDPALPLFHYDEPDKRLHEDDAGYVETIQTNGGDFGFLLPIGKTSFYPNGGEHQPGCLTPICSHERSIEYFLESIALDNFAAIKCENVAIAVANNCGASYSSVRMCDQGNAITATGVYHVPVNKKSPFGVME